MEDQHAHARHDDASANDDVQQHPPRHVLLPQSKSLAQSLPGPPSKHVPALGAHAEHPARAADAVQQVPPAHTPEVHNELPEHGAPGDPAATAKPHCSNGADAQSEGNAASLHEGHCDADDTHMDVSAHQ